MRSRKDNRVTDNRLRHLSRQDLVWVRNFSNGPRWVKGIVERVLSPVSYDIGLRGGIVKRHIDQLRLRVDDTNPLEYVETNPVEYGEQIESTIPAVEAVPPSPVLTPVSNSNDAFDVPRIVDSNVSVPTPDERKETQLRRSTRIRKEPDRLEYR